MAFTTPSEKDLSFEYLLSLWKQGDTSYKAHLQPSFAKVLRAGTSTEYLEKWTSDLQNFFKPLGPRMRTNGTAYKRSSSLTLELIDAGLITTLFKVSQFVRQSTMDASCEALEVLTRLTESFIDENNTKETGAKMIAHGGLEIVCKIIATGDLPKRACAVSLLKALAVNSLSADDFTANQVATAISTCCTHHLDGFKTALNDVTNPEKSHSLQQMFYRGPDHGDPRDQLIRWFAEKQHEALDACFAMLQWRKEPISRQFSLQILQCKPDIMEKLLRIACEARVDKVLKRTTDGLAAQILLHLMILPPEVVPGLDVTFSSQFSDEDKAEWNAALECNQMLYSCPKALEMILEMRVKVLNEDMGALNRDLANAPPASVLVTKSHSTVSGNRANLLVANLRLLINFTYIEGPPQLLFLTLLPLAYEACARVPRVEECEVPENPDDRYRLQCRHIEGTTETLLSSHRSDDRGRLLRSTVASVSLLGPILLFRALFRLTEAGYGLDRLQKLKSLPLHTPIIQHAPTYLVHIHQIVDPRVMGKLIRMSLDRRILERRTRAKFLLQNNISLSTTKPAMAAAAFSTTAELALAIAAFGTHSLNVSTPVIQRNHLSIKRVHQEVVICLGNSAEAVGRAGQWQMAKRFAKYAVDFCATLSEDDAAVAGWNVGILRNKNIRRLAIASAEKHEGIRHCFGTLEHDYLQVLEEGM